MSELRGESRRWRIPPVPSPNTARMLGLPILEETSGELGTLLWRTVRTLHAWGVTSGADRGLLFYDYSYDQRMADLLSAAPEPALEKWILILTEVLREPVRIDPERVGIACLGVAAWARAADKPSTAAEFIHLAALAAPGNPNFALATARESRDRGDYDTAEAYYHRAVVVARGRSDWEGYVRGYAGLGKVFQLRGSFRNARRALRRALKAAERHRLREQRAGVLHELFTVETDCGEWEEAEGYAEAAAEAFGSGHPLLPNLTFDIGVFWADQGRFEMALSILRRTLPFLRPEVQILGWANIARVAGAVSDPELFEDASRRVFSSPPDTHRRIQALECVARGAISLGRAEEAEMAARVALSMAQERGEHQSKFVMEGVLQQVERIGRLATNRGQPDATPPNDATYRSSTLSLSRALDKIFTSAP